MHLFKRSRFAKKPSSITSSHLPHPRVNKTKHHTQLPGPFEEEEEGIGIASDVVTVEGEDPATPRLLSEVC